MKKKEIMALMEAQTINDIEKSEVAHKLIKSINCTHDVRLTHYGLGETHCCVFCGETIWGDSISNWELSQYRNSHCVNLDNINQSEADRNGGYSKYEVFEIIKDIVKDKDDEDEIDLVEEFSKLNLPYCEINNKKICHETYIMIVGGTNTHKFYGNTFVFRGKLKISKAICDFFTSQLDAKVLIIDNSDVIKKIERNPDLEKKSYSTVEELNDLLKNYNQDFRLIIDISELYDYKIRNNKVESDEIDLKLQEKYPNARIIRIKNLNNHSIRELEDYLNGNEDCFAYLNKSYYYFDDGEYKSTSLKEAFQKIKSKI